MLAFCGNVAWNSGPSNFALFTPSVYVAVILINCPTFKLVLGVKKCSITAILIFGHHPKVDMLICSVSLPTILTYLLCQKTGSLVMSCFL